MYQAKARGVMAETAAERPLPEVVYTATGHLGLGLGLWRQMFRELIDSRELTWRLFLRDFSARYRQSVLGYIWAIVPVLVTVATFAWLKKSNVLPIAKTDMPYPLFMLLGMTVWQLFATGLQGATQSLVNAGSLITKINFPRETLVIAAVGQSVFEFLVRVLVRAVLVAGAFVVYRYAPHWTVVLIPLAVAPLVLFTLGLGLILSLVNGVMRDVGQSLTFVLTFWMFLTPVVYPLPEGGKVASLQWLNPVSPFVIAAQDLAAKGYMTRPDLYLAATAISVVLLFLAWRVFHLTEPRIAERV
jgi:lipopolysaccharide transport system permease protein